MVVLILVLLFSLVNYAGLNFYLKKQINQISDSNFLSQKINRTAELDPNLADLITRIKHFEDSKIAEIANLHLKDTFRKEFLGNVSHELRTPLFTAQGYILTLLGDDIDDPELLQKYLKQSQQKSWKDLTPLSKTWI
ncbi:MAG: histidine kinase dimerization/phospho-acceptor domain-containing protein [Flavobacteriaceae bacterium]|nr:histidine kinase dimerization/phospho-acceptor domain-containing protein [Flavobacteriaceae bacterium]